MAVFIVKKNISNPIKKRRCLNCGKDISNKRAHAKFCCKGCYQAYHGNDFLNQSHDRRMGID